MDRTRLSMMPPWENPEAEPLFPHRAQPRSRIAFHFVGKASRSWLPYLAGCLALAMGGLAFASRPQSPVYAQRAIAAIQSPGAVVRAKSAPKTRAKTKPKAKAPAPVRAERAREAAAGNELLDAGHLFYRTGKWDRAEAAYRDALAKNRSDGEARFWLGAAQWKQGKRFRACRHFRIYAEAGGPRSADVRDALRSCE